MANKDDSNTVHEKINFTANKEIERAFPLLLADTGKMSLQTWNNFCDTVDEATEPLQKCNPVKSALCLGIVCCIFLFATSVSWQAWKYTVGGVPVFYPVVGCLLIVFNISLCHVGNSANKQVASKISQLCASASNHDRDLTMTLQNVNYDESDDKDVMKWYIEVTVRNMKMDAENQYATATAIATDTAVAVPVGAAPAAAAASSKSEPPKKYVADSMGQLQLNPEYKAWKVANP